MDPRELANQLIANGYRRTSNKYRMVTRIDDPDWINKLAKFLRRSPAELYLVDAKPTDSVAPMWCGYYRDVLSNDSVENVPQEAFRLIPHSSWDSCGYVPKTTHFIFEED